jgi:hypothetical protein
MVEMLSVNVHILGIIKKLDKVFVYAFSVLVCYQ